MLDRRAIRGLGEIVGDRDPRPGGESHERTSHRSGPGIMLGLPICDGQGQAS